jgi:polyhydroxybutyrate depolymerase
VRPRHLALLASGLATAVLAVSATAATRMLPRAPLATPHAAAGASSSVPTTSPSAAGVSVTDASIEVGGAVRAYQRIAPSSMSPGDPLPAIVFLHGVNAGIAEEEKRDGLLPLAQAGQAVLVYPVGIGESWNAGSCCGTAHVHGIDDVTFLQRLVSKLQSTPGVDAARIYVAGYSNGGRMAFRMACEAPQGVAAFVALSALPSIACPRTRPASLIAVTNTGDTEVPFTGGGAPATPGGDTRASMTGQVQAWAVRDGCPGTAQSSTSGILTLQRWTGCRDGTVVELAAYARGGHALPVGIAATPSYVEVLWTQAAAAASS